jgi:carboxylesterase
MVTTARFGTDAQPWAADGGRVGVALCHGLTGMPGSLRPWGEALAAEGLSVRVPLLPGHGTRWQDANQVRWQDWYAELDRSVDDLRARCDQVFVMGLSMGGTLVLRLAEQRGTDIAGVVALNASLFTTRKDAKLLPVARLLVPSFPPVGNDVKRPGVVEPAYAGCRSRLPTSSRNSGR